MKDRCKHQTRPPPAPAAKKRNTLPKLNIVPAKVTFPKGKKSSNHHFQGRAVKLPGSTPLGKL